MDDEPFLLPFVFLYLGPLRVWWGVIIYLALVFFCGFRCESVVSSSPNNTVVDDVICIIVPAVSLGVIGVCATIDIC